MLDTLFCRERDVFSGVLFPACAVDLSCAANTLELKPGPEPLPSRLFGCECPLPLSLSEPREPERERGFVWVCARAE